MSRASSSQTVAAAIARVRRIAATATEGVTVVAVPIAGAAARERAARAAASTLDALGFRAVWPGQDPAVVPTSIFGGADRMVSHTGLVVDDDREAVTALNWLHWLVGASPCAHVLVDMRDAAARGDVLGLAHAGSAWPTPQPLAWEDLAGRPRWFARERAHSAFGLADRAGAMGLAVAGESAAAAPRVRALIAGARWREAATLARVSLRRAVPWDDRVALGCLAARALLVGGEVVQASALLKGLDAEASLCRVPTPSAVHLERAWVSFWQGRAGEAAQLIERAGDSATRAILCAFVRWAAGDASALAAAIRLMAAADSVEGCPFLRRLARLCRVEVDLASGRRQLPALLAGVGERARDATRLDEAIEDRLLAAAAGDERAAASAAQFMRRSGAWGLARWGLGRQGMQLWHAMPGLLNVVHEAEDEAAILAGSCRWLREQTRAEAAGFVSPRADRWIASAGFSADDLTSDLVRDAARGDGRTVARESDVVAGVAVRWSGGTSGYVLARGRASAAEAMADGVRAVAALAAPALRARLDVLALADAGDSLAPEILGISPAMAEVRLAVARAALTPFPVLIEGESGTGKELVARALHRLSARRDRRFCAVNCAALTDELVEAELFGHSRGAFTGAVGVRVGLFEEAHLGTLFLDEVSELSPRAQAKVLRVLQEREIRRLGENGSRPIDVRIVAATNRPLADGVADGRFRHDLMFRLTVVRIALQPLRERPEDVALLAQTFARRLAPDTGKRMVLGPDALAALARHHWPGNVRELQNAIAALTVLAPVRGRVTARLVAQVLTASAGQDEPVIVPLVVARESLERRLVAASLARHAGRRSAAARELGLSRQGLTKVIKRLGLAHVGRVA